MKSVAGICPYCFNRTEGKTVKTNVKACTKCGLELPYTFGQQKDLVFSVVGAKESGKSHYIAVLLDIIMNKMGEKFQCSLQPLNDETIRRYREEFYYPIFNRGETIQVTPSARTNTAVQRPLLYSLSFYGKGLFGKKKIKSVVTLAFFDTAGEDLNDEETMHTVNRYIYNSSGIIFLIDPLQLTDVREKIGHNMVLPEQNLEVQDLLARTANLIRKGLTIPVDKFIDIPIAVTFSKIDAIDNLIPNSSKIKADSPNIEKGMIDVGDIKAVHDEVRTYISGFGGGHFISQMESNFRYYNYFAVSSLGCSPNGTNKINTFCPRRVEDPFLWLLTVNKLLDNNVIIRK